jgi:DNA polymerase-3 subunit delta
MPANLTIVVGDDDYLVDREARARFERDKKKAGEGVDAEIVDARLRAVADAEVIEQRIRSALTSLSLFGNAKVVWIRALNWLELPKAQAGSESVATILEEHLVPLITQVDPEVRLIVSLCPVNRVRKELKTLKAEAGDYLDIPKMSGDDWLEFAQNALRDAGVKVGPGVAESLLEKVSGSTRVLLGESEKLGVYAGAEGKITVQDVQRLVPNYGEGEAFEVVDALLAADLEWTLDALDRFEFNSSSPRPLLGGLHSRLRLLIQMRALADAGALKLTSAGVSEREITTAGARYGSLYGSGGKSSLNPFTQNAWYLGTKVAPAAANFTLRELIDLQLDLAKVYGSGDEFATFRAACVRVLANRARR